MTASNERQEMLAVNRRQKTYYETTNGSSISSANSIATNLWRLCRRRAMHSISGSARAMVYQRHRNWLGDLAGKKVLELGSGSGTPLSTHIAREAGEYHAIDLSERLVGTLMGRVATLGKTRFFVEDFLSDDFAEENYDVIYAHAVLHHFKDLDVALDMCRKKLKPGGEVISYDPLQTWLPIRLVRAVYRPFQTDVDWEYPFTSKTEQQLRRRFEVVDSFGVFNKAKWALVMGVLSPTLAAKFGDRWFEEDLRQPPTTRALRNSLHISFRLRRDKAT